MPFSKREYYSLNSLERRWRISQDDIMYAIETGRLKASFWLALHVVQHIQKQDNHFTIKSIEPFEGWVIVQPTDCCLIFRRGKGEVVKFLSSEDPNCTIKIAADPNQIVRVHISDLVVLDEDCYKFEQEHDLQALEGVCKRCNCNHSNRVPDKPKVSFVPSRNYQHIMSGEKYYYFGSVQANVVRHLHEAKEKGDPWVHGKTLLDKAGSQAQRLRDIFKHKKDWQSLIWSNGRGYYRLNIEE